MMKIFEKCFSSINRRGNDSERLNREIERDQKSQNDGLGNGDVLIQERIQESGKKNHVKTRQLYYNINMMEEYKSAPSF